MWSSCEAILFNVFQHFGQDRAADPTDPKSEALINAVDADLPAKPVLRAVREVGKDVC